MYAGLVMMVQGKFRFAALAAALCLGPQAWGVAPKLPQPMQRLDLAAYGFPGYSANLIDAGSSLLAAYFADNTHLLLTYSLRGLVERIEGDDPEDFDRAVAALLIELPSGKVVARTRWHLHDHGQYLWPLGHGRFLLRRESTLTTFAPALNLGSEKPFRETTFATLHQIIDVVSPSSDGGLVTVESSDPPEKVKPRAPGTPILLNADDPTPAPKVEFYHFFRIAGSGAGTDAVRAISSGTARVDNTTMLPLSASGYLYATSETKQRWRLHFESYDGATRELEYVDSSCVPHLQWIAPAQFVSFTCRGSDDRLMISAFDFVPRETWEEPLGGMNAFAHFRTAPGAGRFALSRVISSLAVGGNAQALAIGAPNLQQEQLTSQEIRVYQAVSGDLLAKALADPVLRTGQNFDLSEDGLKLMVIHGGAMEITVLRPVSKSDQKDLEEVNAKTPVPGENERIDLRKLLHVAMPKSNAAVVEPAAVAAAPAPSAASPAAVATEPTPVKQGDAAPRKAPTLLNPGEKVDPR